MSDDPREFTREDIDLLVDLVQREVQSLTARIEMNRINPHFDECAASRRMLRLGMVVGKALRMYRETHGSDS